MIHYCTFVQYLLLNYIQNINIHYIMILKYIFNYLYVFNTCLIYNNNQLKSHGVLIFFQMLPFLCLFRN